MNNSSKLSIVSVENFSQTFGNTDYAVFSCQTESNDFLPVAVSHNALRSRGVNIDLLDNLVGSTIIANNDTDIQTGLVTSGKDRVQGILDGTLLNPKTSLPVTILLLNKSNCSIIKSELYNSEMKDLASTTQAKVIVEEKKERKLESSRRIADRLRAKLTAVPTTPKVEESTPSLEVNDEDTPF